MTNSDIITAVEARFPLSGQESWDNSGWQCGDPEAECTGVLLCVDVSEAILDEAKQRGCNLVVAHHPLIFNAVRSIVSDGGRVNPCVMQAIAGGISIYSSHTACDCAPGGVSYADGLLLGLESLETLDTESGLGVIGNLPEPMPWRGFLDKVKSTFGIPCLRHSAVPADDFTVSRVAICGGAAAEFLPLAYERGAQAYVTADCKHNTFPDVGRRPIILVDAGHFETEVCTKELFYRAITEKFPNFAVWKSTTEQNPVKYY